MPVNFILCLHIIFSFKNNVSVFVYSESCSDSRIQDLILSEHTLQVMFSPN